MYMPKQFTMDDSTGAFELINQYPLATVVSRDESDEPFFNHVPLMITTDMNNAMLLGHIAKRNPQWQHFQNNPKATLIFTGPQTYITPSWYVSGRDVPTWNYAVVHVHATTKLVEDFEGLCAILKRMTARFEAHQQTPWDFDLPDDLQNPEDLTSAIIGLEFKIERVSAKFKLSQNRTVNDRENIIANLRAKPQDEMSHKIANLMEQYGSKK